MKNSNTSKLRFGSAEKREQLALTRMKNIKKLRDQGETWDEIGKRYGISRQAVHKFYNENIKLISLIDG